VGIFAVAIEKGQGGDKVSLLEEVTGFREPQFFLSSSVKV